MRKVFLILVLLAVASCIKFHHGKKHKKHEKHEKHGMRHMLHSLKNLPKKDFQKWQKQLLEEKTERATVPESYSEIAEKVNKLKTTWKAKAYDKDYTPYLGAILDGLENLPEKQFKTINADLPDEYDPRTAYPKCESLREIRDQSGCGSCWAFGAVEAMSDRICILSGQTDQRRVSAQNMLACCSSCGFGCDGGYPAYAWRYWKSTGLPTGGLYGDKTWCQPYAFPPCDHHIDGSHGACGDYSTPKCVKNCDDGNKATYYSDLMYGASAYSVFGEKKYYARNL